MIYLIALLHALPVLVIGLGSENRSKTINAAVFMGFLGVITGNPAYILIDLLAVVVACWFCLANMEGPSWLDDNIKPMPEEWKGFHGERQVLGQSQTTSNAPAPVKAAHQGYVDHSARLAAQRKLAYGAAGKPKSIAVAVKRKDKKNLRAGSDDG
jgi:hypothetical protein